MKEFRLVLLMAVILMTGLTGSFAQTCRGFVPLKAGTRMEMKSYDAKNTQVSSSTTTVLSKKNTSLGYEVTVSVKPNESKSGNNKETMLTFKCENGVFIWDINDLMKSGMPGKGMGNMKLSGTSLKFPAIMVAGQKLENAGLKISMVSGGMTMMSILVNFLNRKVEKIEKINTTAGSYSCYKISYDIESKSNMFNMKMHQIDWMAEGIGIVRSESYDEKGKLKNYSVLSAYYE